MDDAPETFTLVAFETPSFRVAPLAPERLSSTESASTLAASNFEAPLRVRFTCLTTLATEILLAPDAVPDSETTSAALTTT